MFKKLAAVLAGAALMLVTGIASATTLPIQYEVYNGNPVGAISVVAGSGPAYYIWANDVARTDWTIEWTALPNQTRVFGGLISAYSGSSSPDNLLSMSSILFESSDFSTVLTAGGITRTGFDDFLNATGISVTWSAPASNGIDGLNIKFLGGYTLPSYLVFDLNIQGQPALNNQINIGSLSGNPESSSFAIAAPVPEPGTMVLLGAGLLGLAIFGKRRMNA